MKPSDTEVSLDAVAVRKFRWNGRDVGFRSHCLSCVQPEAVLKHTHSKRWRAIHELPASREAFGLRPVYPRFCLRPPAPSSKQSVQASAG